jgi:hypothetical protein
MIQSQAYFEKEEEVGDAIRIRIAFQMHKLKIIKI